MDVIRDDDDLVCNVDVGISWRHVLSCMLASVPLLRADDALGLVLGNGPLCGFSPVFLKLIGQILPS